MANANICTRAPVITGYYRYSEITVPVYNITWQLQGCHIAQYQVQFVGSCNMTDVATLSTGSNRTTAVISIPACEVGKCYVRVRAQLMNGSFTAYSLCVLIKQHLVLVESMP